MIDAAQSGDPCGVALGVEDQGAGGKVFCLDVVRHMTIIPCVGGKTKAKVERSCLAWWSRGWYDTYMTNNDTTARLIKAAATLKTANWDPSRGKAAPRSKRTKRNIR